MKKFAALGSVTLMATGAAVTASPANAVVLADCGTHGNATVELINNSICSVTFSSAGAYTFTAPEGVTQLEALLVGAGAGSIWLLAGYAGGAGEVLFVDELDPAVPHSGRIGAGGFINLSLEPFQAESSSLGLTEARPGNFWLGGPGSADSGSGNVGYTIPTPPNPTWGGGAKSAASSTNGGTEGSGYLPSDPTLTLGSALFPVVAGERELARGGKPTTSLPTQFIGWGGSTASSSSQNGADGGVIFRFIAPQAEPIPELAKTGASWLGFMNGVLSAALIGLGALGLRYSLRRKTR